MQARRPARRCASLLSAGATLAMTLAGAPAASADGPHFTPQFSCSGVTVSLTGFPDVPGNRVTEIIRVDRGKPIRAGFVFDGTNASNTIPLQLTAGHHQMDARVLWRRSGTPGGHDRPLVHGIQCADRTELTIEKLQAPGRTGEFTSAPLLGTRRELIRYEILLRNTGTVALSLVPLQEPGCDAGTISGGPGGAALQPGEETIFECTHRLTAADQADGSYENVATISAMPAEGGPVIEESSNRVLVDLPHDAVGFGCEGVTFEFEGFPDLPGNTVQEAVTIDHGEQILVSFSFDGPTGSNTVPLLLAPGRHKLDGWARWNTNAAKGAHDQHAGGSILCASE
jgi:hypothetical protein